MDIRDEYDLLATKLYRENNKSPEQKKEILINLVELWLRSVDTFDRDITDGIEICISEDGTPEIIEYLRTRKQIIISNHQHIIEVIDFWTRKILERAKNPNPTCG